MDYTVETLPAGTQVWASERHRFGTDSLLLASFCGARRSWAACDLGSGCGILLLSLVDKGLGGRAVGIELDAEGAALLAGAAAAGGHAQVQALQADLREYTSAQPFDVVISNPPYYNGGLLPADAVRAAARHQLACTIADVCEAASRNLKYGGRFCVCYPTSGLAELFYCLRAAGLEPKRLQFVRKAYDTPPWLAMVDARKGRGVGLQMLPDWLVTPGMPVQY